MMKVFPTLLATSFLVTTQIELQARSLSADAASTEQPGPSNRRSPLVISEIMYHPAVREDGANLEFIEIYNSQPWWGEISNFRIDGDVRFTFPADARIDDDAHSRTTTERSKSRPSSDRRVSADRHEGRIPDVVHSL